MLATAALSLTCGPEENNVGLTGLETLAVSDVQPRVIVPGTRLIIDGQSFLDAPLGLSSFRMVGTYGGVAVDARLPARFLDFDQMEVLMAPEAIALLGGPEGEFAGQVAASVIFTPTGSRTESAPLHISLSIKSELQPSLSSVDSGGTIFVNDAIEVRGDGFLFGGDEGTTVAVVEGCFTPEGETECVPVAPTPVDVTLTDPSARDVGTFPFSPRIAGIFPGSFAGSVSLENRHAGGSVTESESLELSFDVAPATIGDIGRGGSLGQFIDVPGGGFVGGDEGLTILRLMGDYIPDDGVNALPVAGLELIPEYVDGTLVRYIVNEEDPLGQAIDLRSETGTFDGFIQPVIVFGADEFEGVQTPATFHIDNVRQVVWVKFNPSYVESLRKFGMRAMDSRVRERVLEVLRRDYETINVEFREEEPEDYALYATIEIAGPDPNGLGLLGYDNTPGKDFNNERLFDRIGGVNALTQEDGFPGFGGVFIESIFTYSPNPPSGNGAEVAVPIFDQIFDPFRPDRGGEQISSVDFLGQGVPDLESGGSCPALDRRLQAACAVWVLGSVVGSTVSHELGHSLGLADPLGERFHNLGDSPNRLMDQGGNRSFEERAELMGQGPSIYCIEAYQYLRGILPTDDDDLLDGREHC
ncbi:MAG: hypothetical protein AAF721_06810 [Myxococcota bacterium]